jgi:hypothetical protein
MARQIESTPEFHLNYIEPVAGLFHLQMTVLTMLFRAHNGQDDDVNSLNRWMKHLQRDSNMWDPQRNRVKDHRAAQQLFDVVLDAHILAAAATVLEAKNCEELCKQLEVTDWHEAIVKVQKRYSDVRLVTKLRKKAKIDTNGKSDILYENAILFLQQGLVYRDFVNAMRTGDSGRIKHCLTLFMVWLQGTTLNNYALESLHLCFCLKVAWSKELREFWEDSCLANTSGSPKGWQAEDLVGEQIVKAVKEMVHHNNTPANDHHLRNVHSRQVLLTREARNHMSMETGATQYYKHSTTVKSWFDVRSIADILFQEQVYVYNIDRAILEEDGNGPSVSTDLHGLGMVKVWNGTSIERYKAATKRGVLLIDTEERGVMDSEDEEEGAEERGEPMEEVE